MAHYAFLDENNIVQAVYVGIDENDLTELPDNVSSWEEHYTNLLGMTCKRTSYNTYNNEHILGGTAYRGNYAGIGAIYDEVNDVFYAPQPYPSWTLDNTTWTWQPPIACPQKTSKDTTYIWNEETQNWDLVNE
jgi:hypothetical protein